MPEQRTEIVEHLICRSADELLQSPPFRRVLLRFIGQLQSQHSPLLDVIIPFSFSDKDQETVAEGVGYGLPYNIDRFIELLQLLAHKSAVDIRRTVPAFARLLAEPHLFQDFIEELYNFWRKHERFLILEANPRTEVAQQHQQFIRLNEELKSVVLETYRRIAANLTGTLPQVYRQLPGGAGVGFLVGPVDWVAPPALFPDSLNRQLHAVPLVQTAVIEPPLVYYPKRNFRRGSIEPLNENVLGNVQVDPSQWLCYPAKVGDMIILIFFHKQFLALGASLCNLFELAAPAELAGRQPDGVLLFGVDPAVLPDNPTVYYEDPDSGMVVGLVALTDDVDYFGYFKKTTLTLHNVLCIERGWLPVHGAMARILLRSGAQANVVLVGDSGAGKSESLEAFRVLAGEYLRQLTVIFDDMGSLRLLPADDHLQLKALGTEIGAFVRLDDLEPGFAYSEIDRSIFMNPHKTNARLVIPLTRYQQVVQGWPVHLYLYANNYEAVDVDHPYLEFFTDVEKALRVFSEGARLSKGTTDEEGLSRTYFANPFGAPQKREKHHVLARRYLTYMMEHGIKVGQLRTQLGLPGYALKGPESAAKALFEYLTSEKVKSPQGAIGSPLP